MGHSAFSPTGGVAIQGKAQGLGRESILVGLDSGKASTARIGPFCPKGCNSKPLGIVRLTERCRRLSRVAEPPRAPGRLRGLHLDLDETPKRREPPVGAGGSRKSQAPCGSGLIDRVEPRRRFLRRQGLEQETYGLLPAGFAPRNGLVPKGRDGMRTALAGDDWRPACSGNQQLLAAFHNPSTSLLLLLSCSHGECLHWRC